MRKLMNTWQAWFRPVHVGCAWHEGHMVGAQLQAVSKGSRADFQVKAMHVCAHAWGAEQLAQGTAAGLPWEQLQSGMQVAQARVALACPQAWVASGGHVADASSKRQTVLADIQVQAAQAVGEDCSNVCFDAHVGTQGPWQWWATSSNWVQHIQADLAPLALRLRRVSPQYSAQCQALARLEGGESSLQARPPMDWQFSREPQHAQATVHDWLQVWAKTAQGLRLAACGMVLPV